MLVVAALAAAAAPRAATWCGAAPSARLVAEAQAMDAWWRREDPGRTLRFDRSSPGPGAPSRSATSTSRRCSCRGGSDYLACQPSLNAFSACLSRDLVDARGFPQRGPKKYLVYDTGPLVLAVAGRGSIVSSEGSCRRRCSVHAETGGAVIFRTKPAAGWKFVRWTSGCHGRWPRCTLAIEPPLTVAARFRRMTT